MEIADLCHAILFGDRWEDKLLAADSLSDLRAPSPLATVPAFPGRPRHLRNIGRTEFPAPESLKEDAARGRLLHFFANHELLAMELMALMLLKFPDAPPSFRAGIAATIREEQNHLRLYVARMQELGVGFGELPVSDYFWNLMKGMSSPLEFVTQMSLTLEQANLDFSLFYQRAVAKVGDEKTAAILDRVYREEIGHVKHGLSWFNQWRHLSEPSPTETDWEAYRRLLPLPLNPRRAKGSVFFSEPRRQAGFSEQFIQELEVFSGSKGRPPVFWFFNPWCDAEIARGKTGYTAPSAIKRLEADLATIPMYLALETDVCLVDTLPRAEFLKELQSLGFTTPEFRRLTEATPKENKISGIEPWGWSPEVWDRFRSWSDRLVAVGATNAAWCGPLLQRDSFAATGLGPLFSKSWSASFLRSWLEAHPEHQAIFGTADTVGETYADWTTARQRLEAAFAARVPFVAKAPWGASGTQNKRLLDPAELDSTLGGWIRNTIETQGGIVLEPWLDKAVDLSMQIEVTDTDTETRIVGVRPFITGSRSEYRGTQLDPKLRSVPVGILRFLHSGKSPLAQWEAFALDLGETLRGLGYRGPAGLDALVWRHGETYRLKPLVELNPRWTMGRVALEIETHVAPGISAAWIFVGVKDAIDVKAIARRHPPKTVQQGSQLRITEGIVFTSDPERAQAVYTVLAVGKPALNELGWTTEENG